MHKLNTPTCLRYEHQIIRLLISERERGREREAILTYKFCVKINLRFRVLSLSGYQICIYGLSSIYVAIYHMVLLRSRVFCSKRRGGRTIVGVARKTIQFCEYLVV